MKLKIATYQDLKQISSHENGESFVIINFFDSSIKYNKHNKYNKKNLKQQNIVRETVAKKIAIANNRLQKNNPNFTLFVIDGYKALDIQKKYFNREYQSFKKKYNNFSKKQLMELTHSRISVPEVAGHPTGGAIDITIYNIKQKIFLDMGGKIADFSDDKMATFSKKITEQQQNNRLLLHNILIEQEFCPYYKEWWHFSYGDKEWAFFYNKKNTLYCQRDLSEIILK